MLIAAQVPKLVKEIRPSTARSLQQKYLTAGASAENGAAAATTSATPSSANVESSGLRRFDHLFALVIAVVMLVVNLVWNRSNIWDDACGDEFNETEVITVTGSVSSLAVEAGECPEDLARSQYVLTAFVLLGVQIPGLVTKIWECVENTDPALQRAPGCCGKNCSIALCDNVGLNANHRRELCVVDAACRAFGCVWAVGHRKGCSGGDPG